MRLQSLIQLLGYETKMIRTEDISIYREGKSLAQKKISDLKERKLNDNTLTTIEEKRNTCITKH